MSDAPRTRRSGLAVPILLGLMLLAQIGIANEIRYQGCVARLYEITINTEGASLAKGAREFRCRRAPLL